MSEKLGRKFVEYVMSRLGLRANILRPVPEFSMNPFYWLGALTAIAFGLQVITGLLMLLYYVPSTDQAYSSTLYVINSVPLGGLIETIHLYGAYAMILMALLHMFRGYFVSVHKSPRELMWVIGMLMGLTVFGFGLTGYLLPWTVVSKSATDVSIGMLSFLPAQIGPIATFLVAGSGGDAATLTRFFDLHIVVLPAALLSLLLLKMSMFEAHGAAEPPSRAELPSRPEARESRETGTEGRELPWFPNVYLYFAMIGSVFVALTIVASAIFPLTLPPQFSPQAASNNVPQPDWYFLWVYQILKFASFEGSGIYFALGIVTAVMAGLVLLPFIDRGYRRNPALRPRYVTVGFVLIIEVVALTVWGYLTPGEVIPDVQGVEVLGTAALATVLVSASVFRMRRSNRGTQSAGKSILRSMFLPSKGWWATSVLVALLCIGSVCLANIVGSLSVASVNSSMLALNSALLLATFYMMARITKNMTIAYRRSQP